MTQWTDKHYDFTYTLTSKDIEQGSVKLDPYFVSKQWKTGSKDDSGALFHVLKTVARFGDKNDVEREVKALYAQVLGVARSFSVDLEPPQTVQFDGTRVVKTQASLWYPDDSGEWVEYGGSDQPVEDDVVVEVLLQGERYERCWIKYPLKAREWEWDWGASVGNTKIVAYKVVE